jgi:glycosyltransferase involved in cell wall biosynthesis
MPERISVVIPLFNKGPFIARTLNSVLNQTFKDFEVIIVNDGSTDDGEKIVKGFDDPRIRLISQVNQGETAARNSGIENAKSDFIAFLDADDEWLPKHLETIFRLIDKFPGAGIYTTAYKIRTTDGKMRWAKYDFIPNPPWEGIIPNYFKSGCVGDFPVSSSNVVIPRKILHEMGGFPLGYWWGGDVDLFGRIALRYPVVFSWELGAIYHWDDLNRASARTPPLDFEEPLVKTGRAAFKNGEVLPEFVEYLNEYISRTEIGRAVLNVKAGNRKTATIILKQCNTKLFYYDKMKWLFLARLPPPVFRSLNNIHGKILHLIRKKKNKFKLRNKTGPTN